jgi:hypothetical protein
MTTNCPVSAYPAPGLKRRRKILSGKHAENAGCYSLKRQAAGKQYLRSI